MRLFLRFAKASLVFADIEGAKSMNRLFCSCLRVAAALAVTVPTIGADGQPSGRAQAPGPVSESDLDILVSSFLPGAAFADAIRVRFEESYRAAHDADPDHAALEQRYPGMHLVMRSAALEEMLRSVTVVLDRISAELRADLRADLSAEDARALARLFGHPAARRIAGTRLHPRDGETYAQMVSRSLQELDRTVANSRDAAELERLLQSFAATPQGQRLLPRVEAYQAMAQRQLREALGSAQFNAVHAGMRAANSLVRRSHPTDPPPFPNAQPR